MQCLAFEGKWGLFWAVHGIPQYRMTYGCHVNTDLMGPSCLQPAFDVGILSETFQDRIMRNRVSACTLTGSQDSHLLAVLRMPSDRSVDHTFIQAQIAVNNGPVAPVDGMVLQLLTETVVCRIGLGDHQGSGGVPGEGRQGT